jgi:cyanophycinase
MNRFLVAVTLCCLLLFSMANSWADGPDREKDAAANGPLGSLVICGGGSLPEAVLERFVELAGGDHGRLVVIPTASSKVGASDQAEMVNRWAELGIGNVSILHARDRTEADSSTFTEPIDQATAVWFGGGQQSRLADRYVGTATEQAVLELFRRGGVVGGTSAGAAIQSRVMIQSGNPIPVISTGIDLLDGAIVDQHFLKRNRFNRLLHAVRSHPDRTGVGIAESTAVIHQRGECAVLGDSFVAVISAKEVPASVSVETFRSGQSFSLSE